MKQARHHKGETEREAKENEKLRQQLLEEKEKNARLEKLLAIAKAKAAEYAATHPDWQPADQVLLQKEDEEDARTIYTVVSKTFDLEAQMKYDPTGTMTTFWAEQGRMLKKNTNKLDGIQRYTHA